MKKALHSLAAALLFWLLTVVILCGTVLHLGCDAALYARAFAAYADTAAHGVEADQYPLLADRLAAYLAGRTEDAQCLIRRGGEDGSPAYNARELAHLADIRALFRLLRRAWVLLLPAAALAALLLRRRAALGSVLCGFLLSLLPWAAAGLWIALDFEGAFIAMHRLLFTNELWLLDPRTDLLICLMPQPLFVELAGRLAWIAVPATLLLPAPILLYHLIRKQK